MMKTSKRKTQWRSLDIKSDSTINEDPSAVKPHSEFHPFLKIISKNMDAIVKKDSTQASDESKLVYPYRSDKKVGVNNLSDLSQYAGKPIQYKPAQHAQDSSTLQYYNEQQQQIYYPPFPAYTPTIHTPPSPSNGQDMFIPHLTSPTPHSPQHEPYPMTMYYTKHLTNQQIQIPALQQIPYYQPPLLPTNLPNQPHLPQVEYVPYYYYYPVPVPNPSPPENHCLPSSKTQSLLKEQTNNGSTSCDSCSGKDKVIRRRRKKKKFAEESKDVDSGYFNGEEWSSELNSEEDTHKLEKENTAIKQADTMAIVDSGIEGTEENEKEITNLLIKQIENPTIDFQFGEVQEILDELNKTKHSKNEDEKEKSLSLENASDTNNDLMSKFDSETLLGSLSTSNKIKTVECIAEETFDKDTATSELDTLYAVSKEGEQCKSTKAENRNDVSEKKVTLSKGKKRRNNKKNKVSSENISNPAENIICVPDEPLFEEKSTEALDSWTTVSNSRKNKYNSHKNALEVNNEVANDNQELPKEILEDDLYLNQEEAESKKVCPPIKDLGLITEADPKEKTNLKSLNSCTKIPSKKEKQKKKPKSKSNKNTNISDDKDIAPLESVDKDNSKNIPKPLEDMNELFYQDKTVEIVNLPLQDESKKDPSRKQKNKNKITNVPKTNQSHILEENKNNGLNDNENLMAELIDMNFPILFFHPFSNFEDQLQQDHASQLDLANNSQPIKYNEDPMTFLDPTFSPHIISDYSHLIAGGKNDLATRKGINEDNSSLDNLEQLEEQLVDMNVLKHHHTHVHIKIGKNKMVMFRPQNINGEIKPKPTQKSPVKKIEVPGPRVKYSPVIRSGPLGVRRHVVPPLCLATRFTRI